VEEGRGAFLEGIYNVLDRRMEERVFPLLLGKGMGFIARTPLAQGFLAGPRAREFGRDDVRAAIPPEDAAWRRRARERLGFLEAEPGGVPSGAIRFCLAHPAVTTVIPGMRTRDQVMENVVAAGMGPLGESAASAVRNAIPEPFPGWKEAKR
jgi:aryl-alcohol dehydrogenase-like predicted oxidoreductase